MIEFQNESAWGEVQDKRGLQRGESQPSPHREVIRKGFHANNLSQVGEVLIETQHFRGKKKEEEGERWV